MNCKTCRNYEEHIYLDITASPEHCANYKPKEHEWEVGDWVYDTKQHKICRITRSVPMRIELLSADSFGRHQYDTCIDNLRSITPADWTREVDGVKYRAYEDNEGRVVIYMDKAQPKGNRRAIYDTIFLTFCRSFCRLAGIPIMPYELSQGKYEFPT